MTVRIAMWSGPRNISTALMRAWENREDCVVVDEPLYAHYLHQTRLRHPGFDDVIASQSTDWRVVTEGLSADRPEAVWYQKHMTHHMLPEVGREWMADVVNVFLIRDPAEVVASYVQRRGEATLEDLGLPQQWELFEYVTEELGREPIVVESRDVLADPEGMLRRLCSAIGVPFSDRMLSWPAGPRTSDGVWAKHWYANVEASTGFQSPKRREVRLTKELQAIADQGRVFYDRLSRHGVT
jgi:hypothetical protein